MIILQLQFLIITGTVSKEFVNLIFDELSYFEIHLKTKVPSHKHLLKITAQKLGIIFL